MLIPIIINSLAIARVQDHLNRRHTDLLLPLITFGGMLRMKHLNPVGILLLIRVMELFLEMLLLIGVINEIFGMGRGGGGLEKGG